MVGCTKDPCRPALPNLTISRQPDPPLLLEMANSVHSLSKTSIWQCITARHGTRARILRSCETLQRNYRDGSQRDEKRTLDSDGQEVNVQLCIHAEADDDAIVIRQGY